MNRILSMVALLTLTAGTAAADPRDTTAEHLRMYERISSPPALKPGHWVPALPVEAAAMPPAPKVDAARAGATG